MEILDMTRQPADLRGERSEQGTAQSRVTVDQVQECVAVEDERLGRLDRDDRGRVRRSVEDRELTEELARAEDRHDRGLRPLVARQDDLDRAAGEDEQRVAWVALVKDGLTA